MVDILIKLLAILSILVGMYFIIYAHKKRDDMPKALYGFKKNDFSITDKNGFNRMMVKKYFVSGMILIIFGGLSFFEKSFIAFLSILWAIDILADSKAKKYIVIN